MAYGSVRWFNSEKGYGFIAPDGGAEDVFVHFTAVELAGLSGLVEGDRVIYDLERSPEGRPFATNLDLG